MAAAATVEPGATATAPSLATEELIRAISATNRASGRRTCTTLLNQWKKEILPKISRSILFELLADADGFGGGGDAVAASDRFNPCDDKGPSILTALIMIINHHDDFSTEGHRESSVEILKLLCRRAFADDNENDAGKGTDTVQEKRLHMTLLKVFHRYLQLFQNRMTFHNASNNDGFHHGTMTEPREPSEHIRLLLVELMVDLGGYCLTSFSKDCFAIVTDDKWNKMIIEATSDICQTLSKSTFLDPYPEISRAACDLVQLLAQLCPLAVRMNAASLLVPLSGRVSNDTRGGVEQSSTASISKKCLMRHRHAKTRCKAVEASTGIVLCCPRLGKSMPIKDEISADMPSISVVGHLSNDGSHSTSMEHILQHSLLPEWEDLLKLDCSASVKLSVLQSLGSIANTLKWSYSPDPTITFQPPIVSASDLSNLQHTNTTTTDITTVVEARVLTLFLVGMSKGSVAGVRSLAIQQLRGLSCEGNGGMLSKNFLVSYFGPMLELLLSSCSNGWACCQSRVSSLDALQVLFSITIPLMNDGSSESSTCATQVRLSDTMIHDIVNILSMNILSDEKVVIEASFACCHTLGANDSVSNAVVALLCDLDDLRATVIDDDFEAMAIHSNESKVAPSPRHLTSQLLILDKLLKGSITSKEAASILREVDPTIYIPTPHWFHESLSSATAISKLFYHTAITNNVSSSSSLAWALADACDSFANCVHDIESKLSLTEDIIVNVLVAVAYLLGCPSEFDLSSKAMGTLRLFSSSEGLDSTCEEKGSSLFDVHFRKLFAMIVATAPPFPWKQSEPALLAVDALLRACSGSTVGSSFDMVAPFFISHVSTMDYNNNSTDGAQHPCSNGDKLNDEMPEDYPLRISLMAMLQTILTDKSFSSTLTNQQCGPSNDVSSSFSAQFTADVILSIVLPNLVWRVGGMASALRKLSLATLFSLLIGRTALIHPDILSCLIPTLHSSFDDADSSVRELSCVCLSLTIQQVSNEMFSITWENNPQAIDTILPRLLELLDDSHGPVRIAACNCLRDLFPLVQSNISLSSHETITASLLIQLDDPDEDFQSQVFQALSKLVELQSQYKDSGVVEMMARQINSSMKSHRDTSLCRELLGKLEQMHNSQ